MYRYFTFFVLLAISGLLYAQNTTYATETFRDTRIISGQSVETSIQGQANLSYHTALVIFMSKTLLVYSTTFSVLMAVPICVLV
jgi:hypothetical protein